MDTLDTILLVEDNPDDADLIRYAFKKAQIDNPIHHADDGQKAVEFLRGDPPFDDRARYPLPRLILLDLKLPRLSGFEVLQWIREDATVKHLPVVVLTSSNQSPDIERAYELCANSYLVKPVNRDALLDMVKSLNYYWIKLNRSVRA
jgi:CheY-like chemotaxis protein